MYRDFSRVINGPLIFLWEPETSDEKLMLKVAVEVLQHARLGAAASMLYSLRTNDWMLTDENDDPLVEGLHPVCVDSLDDMLPVAFLSEDRTTLVAFDKLDERSVTFKLYADGDLEPG